jgi:hypothetical protein
MQLASNVTVAGQSGKHAPDADLFRQHVEHRQRVAIAVDRGLDRRAVEAAAYVERAVVLLASFQKFNVRRSAS